MPVPGISPVSLFMPGMAETQVALSNIDRQRALAQALQQQSLEPIQAGASQGPLGAVTAPMSWTQGLAKLAQGYAGGTMQHNLDDRQLALIKGLTGQYSGMFGPQQTAPASSSATQFSLSNTQPSTNELGMTGGGPGPTTQNASLMDQIVQQNPQAGTTRPGPLQMPGVDPATAMARYAAFPEAYGKQLMTETGRTEAERVAANMGIKPGSSEYNKVLANELLKLTHTPIEQLRQGSIGLDPATHLPIAYNPQGIPGAFTQFKGGMPTGYAQAPGAQGIMAGNAAAQSGGTEYGRLNYGTQTLNTPGNPTVQTNAQVLRGATGQEPPLPYGMQPQASMQPSSQWLGPQPQGNFQGDPQQVMAAMQRGQWTDPAEKAAAEQALRNQVSGTQGPAPTQVGLQLQDQGAGAAQRKSGEGMGEVDSRIRLAGMDANLKINKFERLGNLLDNVDTGKLQPAGYELAAYAQSLGLPIDAKVPNYQAAKSLANEMALELRNPSGGAGMPGNFSDQDRAYLQSIIANVDKTPGANRLLVDGMIKMYQRDREIASLANDFKKTHQGVLNDDFFTDVQKYSDSHPLFPPASPIRAGATRTTVPAPQTLTPAEQLELQQLRQRFKK